MHRAIQGGALHLSTFHEEAPPHWAVAAVKASVIGILALPVLSLLWLFVSPLVTSQAAVLAPIAFGTSIGLGVTLFGVITFLTGAYPPVPPSTK